MYGFAKKLGTLAIIGVLFAGLVRPSYATFTPVPFPDTTYQAITDKIDISGLPNFSDHGSITDGFQTVTFSTPLEKRTVPGSWSTWGSPPDTESATPPVMWTQGATSVDMLLSCPVDIFGFEAEPNPFLVYDITADFYSGATLLGSITRSVDGLAGARLFASVDDTFIDKVVVSSKADFAMAQFRYHECDCPPVPEPGTMGLLGAGALGLIRRRKNGINPLAIA